MREKQTQTEIEMLANNPISLTGLSFALQPQPPRGHQLQVNPLGKCQVLNFWSYWQIAKTSDVKSSNDKSLL